MFQVKVIDIKSVLFSGEAEGVYFNVDFGGQIGILNNHVNSNYKIVPSCLYIFTKKEKIKLFIGYGYASIRDNFLGITGIPIARTFEDYDLRVRKLGDYGESCLKDFIYINL